MTQPTLKPTQKVNAAGAGPIVAGLVITGVAVFFPDIYARIPDVPGFELQLGLGIGGLVAWISGWLRRERV